MANNKVRLPYQIIFLPNLILCSSLYLFLLYHLSFLKKRYKPMVDYGVKKTSKGGKKKNRRRKDGETDEG